MRSLCILQHLHLNVAIAPPLVIPFGRAIDRVLELRSCLYDEIAQEVEAIGFPGIAFGSAEGIW